MTNKSEKKSSHKMLAPQNKTGGSLRSFNPDMVAHLIALAEIALYGSPGDPIRAMLDSPLNPAEVIEDLLAEIKEAENKNSAAMLPAIENDKQELLKKWRRFLETGGMRADRMKDIYQSSGQLSESETQVQNEWNAAYDMLLWFRLREEWEHGRLYIKDVQGELRPVAEDTLTLSVDGKLYYAGGSEIGYAPRDIFRDVNFKGVTVSHLTDVSFKEILLQFFDLYDLGISPTQLLQALGEEAPPAQLPEKSPSPIVKGLLEAGPSESYVESTVPQRDTTGGKQERS